MAFVASIQHNSMLREKAHSPTNTGGGNPRPIEEPWVKPPITKPPIVVRPRCIPRPYMYPKYLRLPVGPNRRGRHHLLRYSCLRTTMRWLKIYRAIRQQPLFHTLPLDQLPIGQIDRNPAPISGGIRVHTNKVKGVKNVVVS